MKLDASVCDRARLARDARFDGQFFIAVRSTGIYCRPICPSPTARRENVRFFESAEEAVAAGYRPCLRCRPETAPGTPAWNGTSTTVTRALRLIASGEIPERRIGALSERLGVSARHLSRLFQRHLGASPIAVAKTWRLHFAKELISDTGLPMFRVAAASGFRSVRRFNYSIRAAYGRSPSELRRLRPVPLPAGADEYVFQLPYRSPCDWETRLEQLAGRAIPGVEEVAAGAYRRSFTLGDRHGVLEVRDGARALEARVRFPGPASLLPIVMRLRAMFGPESAPRAASRRVQRDRPPDPPGAWDEFEVSVLEILRQGTSMLAASSLAGRIARAHGQRLSFPDAGGLTHVFPCAEALMNARLPGIPRAQAAAISVAALAAGSAFAGGERIRH